MNSYYEKIVATGEVKCIDEEIPFAIPKGWEWVRMGVIGDWGAGATPAKGNAAYYSGNILWLRTGELNDGIVYDTKIKVTQKALAECSLRINKIGDVLIAMYGATIGKVAIVGKELTTNQACCACTPFGIYNWFLFYFLMGSKEDFVKKGEGGAQPNISREKLIHHLMPLPPLAEQRRIVEKTRDVLLYIKQYENLQKSLNALNGNIRTLLKKSILQEAIQGRLVPQIAEEGTAQDLLERIKQEKLKLIKGGKLKKSALTNSVIFKGDDNKYYENNSGKISCIDDEIPFEIPSSWAWVRLGCIYNTTSGGTPEKGHPEYYCGGNILWAKVGDLKEGHITDVEERITQIGLDSSSAKLFPTGTLLVAMYCNDAIGKASIIDVPMSTNQAICGLYPNPYIVTEYVYYVITANKSTLQEKSAGGAQKNINQKIINQLLIPLPPVKEQQRIVNKILNVTSIMSRWVKNAWI